MVGGGWSAGASRGAAVHVLVLVVGEVVVVVVVKALGVSCEGWAVWSPSINRGAVLLRAFNRAKSMLRLFLLPTYIIIRARLFFKCA